MRSDSKTASKSPKAPRLIPQASGRGALLSGGKPGNRGGAGRPPNAFRDFLSQLRNDPQALDALKRAASDETLKSFGSAWKLIASYDPERPTDRKELSGQVALRIVIEREGRRRTAS